jgi:hypothetical protein
MLAFQEVLAWWHLRKLLLILANEIRAATERWTVHMEKPFIERIKADADAEHVTVTEMMSRIVRHYYAGGERSTRVIP